MSNTQEQVSKAVRIAMALTQETQADLAQVLSVDRSAVSARLKGRTSWSLDDLDALAEHCCSVGRGTRLAACRSHHASNSHISILAMESPYLTVREVASHLRVDPLTVRRWCQDGRLQALRPGGKVFRISQDSLKAFLAESAGNSE